MWSDIVEGMRVVSRDPILRATTLASMTWNLFSGGLLDAIYVLYLSRELQLAPSQAATLFVTSGLAGVVGALVWPRLVAPRLGIGPSLILADTLSVLGTLCIPFVQGSPEQVVLLLSCVSLTIGFAMPMVFVGGSTLRQAFSPPELIGRVSASITFVLIGVVPFGALLGGALGEAIGPRGALLVAGVGILLTPVWLLISPVRSLERGHQERPVLLRARALELPRTMPTGLHRSGALSTSFHVK